MKRHILSFRGSTLLEYAFIIGTISVVLFTMNTYAKRGVQSKIRDMSDHFISGGQTWHEGKTDASVDTYSEANSSSNATVAITKDADQTTHLAYLDNSTISADSRSEDWITVGGGNSFQGANRGRINTPHYPTNQTIENRTAGGDSFQALDCITLAGEIDMRVAERQALLDGAAAGRQTGDLMRDTGNNLVNRANHIDCDGSRRCRRARSSLRASGYTIRNSSNPQYQKAQRDAERAAELDDEISALEQEYDRKGCEND